MDFNNLEDGDNAGYIRPPTRHKPGRGHHRRKIEPYAWLTAGALGIGIATAISAPAVAHADESSSPSSSVSAPSSTTAGSSETGRAPRALGQKARSESGSRPNRLRVRAADADSESAQGNDNRKITRDSTTKRTHTSTRETDSDTEVSTDRSHRELDQSAAQEKPATRATVEKTLASSTVDATPAPKKKPTPPKLREILTALFTRSNGALVDRTTAGTRGGSTSGLARSAQVATTQSTPLRNLLSTLFPRLRGVPAAAGSTTAPPTSTPEGGAAAPTKDDAGLTQPFERPDTPTGRTLNVRNYGASSNWALDNDAQAIQRAINAATAGDTVYIPKGTYHIRSTINLKSGVSLIGETRDSTVLAGAFWTAPHAMIYAAPGTTNLTISSFKITSASGPTYKAAIRLGMEGGSQVSRIAVQNVFIERFERFGVQLQNAHQVLVEGNTIKNATALGGGGKGYGVIIDQAQSNNNWITRNEIGPVIRHAILVQFSANHNLIDYNTITGTVSGAIDLHGEDEYANEIAYNTISNGVRNGTTVSPNGAGIEIGEYSGAIGMTTAHDNSGPGNYVHHNTVYNYSMGLRVVNNSNYTFIEDNIFHDNLGAGIRADLAPLNNLYISGNQIYNNGSGVVLYDVTQAVVENNTIRDNRDSGLWINAGTSAYLITGNLISGSKVNVTLLSTLGVYLPGLEVLPLVKTSA